MKQGSRSSIITVLREAPQTVRKRKSSNVKPDSRRPIQPVKQSSTSRFPPKFVGLKHFNCFLLAETISINIIRQVLITLLNVSDLYFYLKTLNYNHFKN